MNRDSPCCDRLVEQTALFAAHLDGADLALPVAACPGWTLRNLVRHVAGGHRWAEETVRTRSAEPLPAGLLRGSGTLHGPLSRQGFRRGCGAGRLAGHRAARQVTRPRR
ncbi:maleylpyruvate isomerase N-terminal domain-containing protein [Streptomonospora alba]|uniref:maleylpyruvate isomerase N-terminal domain-containing protein n=1 Tax=Streptomonospora alba TaxID=183763 RepID=UPI0009FD18A3